MATDRSGRTPAEVAVTNRRTRARPRAPSHVAVPPPAPVPAHRRLKVFSLDPRVDVQLEHSLISRSVLPVPWEPLTPGPVGEYLEVVDVDPSSSCVYDPVDLNDPDLLAQDGLSPSAGNPQFHQQMVYAVGMKTISNFERVLGRKILWAERRYDGEQLIREPAQRYVRRLRIYPHALRDQNAYYSPPKAALLFGYFNAPTTDPRDELPGGLVFTCLSHDIVAHEMTHAILDGMHRRMLDASNPDMVALHEAFADIVAIFQHFTLPGLLLDQIQRTRGNLWTDSLLAQLAGQFARATGQGNALRNALGTFDEQGRRAPPDPTALGRTFEPHDRGAILVAAVFDAFIRMYDNRVADLRRIATGGTGVLPVGDIHPDLARRFADEAVQLSQRVLNMCIRALDYLPPVDPTYGDFLRAIITADADSYPDDPSRHRLAFIQSFRDRGIYPLDVRALAEDALRWKPLDDDVTTLVGAILPPAAVLRTMAAAYDSTQMTQLLGNVVQNGDPDSVQGEIWEHFARHNFESATRLFLDAAWRQEPRTAEAEKIQHGERYPRYQIERLFAKFLHGWIKHKANALPMSELDRQKIGWNLGIDMKGLTSNGGRKLEVHAVRPTVRLRSDGRSKIELLIVLTQRRRIDLLADPRDRASVMRAPNSDQNSDEKDDDKLSFCFRGGSTLIVDPEIGAVTYAIGKNILSESRMGRHMEFLRNQLAQQGTAAIARFGLTEDMRQRKRRLEPFALAHAHASLTNAGTY
jgi:hypothetical protein